jgi:hypothetical protein
MFITFGILTLRLFDAAGGLMLRSSLEMTDRSLMLDPLRMALRQFLVLYRCAHALGAIPIALRRYA